MLQIPAAAAARLGPWLMRAGPAAGEAAVAAVTKAGATGIKSVSDIVRYIGANKMNTAVVFSSLASAGFAVSDLFSPADKQDPEARVSATSLSVAELKASDSRLIDVAGDSENLAGLSGSREDLVLLRRILQWAKGHYGSAASAVEAWKSQQAFFELSLADIENGFAVLDV